MWNIVLGHRRLYVLRGLCKKVKVENMPDSGDAVLPSDFLTFHIITREIANWYFHHANFQASYFCGNFRFKTKTITLEVDVFQDFGTEEFVAGFHISEVKPTHNIAQHGENTVHEIVERPVHLH